MSQSFKELKSILSFALEIVENLQGNHPVCLKCGNTKAKNGKGRKLEQTYVCWSCKGSKQLPANDS